MEVVVAPAKNSYNWKTSVFLAGGITDCYDWQSDVIDCLKRYDNSLNLIVYNPRRANFDINNDSAREQIEWEYDTINNKSDIFSMYFCSSESDQPICMYELGMRLGKLNREYSPFGYRTIISIEDGYKRANDIIVQTKLAVPKLKINLHANPVSHANCIIEEYNRFKDFMKIF
jgi:hypothetical protein